MKLAIKVAMISYNGTFTLTYGNDTKTIVDNEQKA